MASAAAVALRAPTVAVSSERKSCPADDSITADCWGVSVGLYRDDAPPGPAPEPVPTAPDPDTWAGWMRGAVGAVAARLLIPDASSRTRSK